MNGETISPLRRRMIEDMTVRTFFVNSASSGMSEKILYPYPGLSGSQVGDWFTRK